ncbi:flavin-containing monooxygenase [Kordiimonas marina]|uniref:flavin-containing monooxygenase n=1 Tax=Kordiimonas marina TaxID=2872312 RepID=UPI001FF38B74|nr:NAD(P)/FAD-dependent oxidoreductase [Kordiimonas marina]MCJ9430527.1 NAD(P)/FAD-dependent oxidoreductase [Kordiimonas marina]
MNAIHSFSGEEPLDVLIVGAGISGIGCGCYLTTDLPEKTWAIVEGRGEIGGTWDLFRYPGIRSDSDLFTFGYDFKPWRSDKAIAGADEIMSYLRETVEEYDLEKKIRFHHKVTGANWDSEEALWTVTLHRSDIDADVTIKCRWLFGATGYYDYDEGFRPEFKGEEDFKGQIIHPQHWPEDLDYTGKRIAVIGSGATAVTLVPAMTPTAAHVTQIQRTPTYVLPMPSEDKIGNWLKRWLPAKTAYALTRWKNVRRQRWVWLFCQKFPNAARNWIRKMNVKELPEGYPVDVHFKPPYGPWDQRLCAVPDGDFFKELSAGRASIVTGQIDRFTETGVLMESGEEIPADIIVTATGLNMKLFGGIELRVDHKRVLPPQKLVFKGMMLDGVPNFCFAVGYTNSSWTLKIGLLCQYFCRLLKEMDDRGMAVCVPERPEGEIETRPLMDFGAGYVKRAIRWMPRQGDREPWEMTFSYIADAHMVKHGPVIDPALHLSPAPTHEPKKEKATA